MALVCGCNRIGRGTSKRTSSSSKSCTATIPYWAQEPSLPTETYGVTSSTEIDFLISFKTFLCLQCTFDTIQLLKYGLKWTHRLAFPINKLDNEIYSLGLYPIFIL